MDLSLGAFSQLEAAFKSSALSLDDALREVRLRETKVIALEADYIVSCWKCLVDDIFLNLVKLFAQLSASSCVSQSSRRLGLLSIAKCVGLVR